MKMTRKRLFFLLLLSFSSISFIRLLIITTTFSAHSGHQLRRPTFAQDTLTSKEFNYIKTLISKKAPCNVLFFGLSSPQHIELAKLNRAGNSVFLEDDYAKIRDHQSGDLEVYMVNHNYKSNEAYDLLKYARIDDNCRRIPNNLHESRCKLLLTNLPKIIHNKKWDIILIDGPTGSGPNEPGRMSAIYTSAIIARIKHKLKLNLKSTDVIVHNVDRTAEKWFSYEFLCDENLVGSKGRLWHFRIKGKFGSGLFCGQNKVKIV
ncbi:hypothetical protein LUZ60_007951 [Juncus effusus]|nr:hypothetical protein LUZ60_007951 [Juncus effusus]